MPQVFFISIFKILIVYSLWAREIYHGTKYTKFLLPVTVNNSEEY